MAPADLNVRLGLLRIDDDTRANLKTFLPVLERRISGVIDGFYKFILTDPEARSILSSEAQVRALRLKQKTHWLKLFSGEWVERFRDMALAIGDAHFRAKIPPYLYVAGYTYFQCELMRIAAENYRGADAERIMAAIIKTINLDMELALASYSRAAWNRG